MADLSKYTHQFNTGRQYTSEGQIIHYVETSREDDDFLPVITYECFDISRLIRFEVKLAIFDDSDHDEIQRDILAAYDKNDYKHV